MAQIRSSCKNKKPLMCRRHTGAVVAQTLLSPITQVKVDASDHLVTSQTRSAGLCSRRAFYWGSRRGTSLPLHDLPDLSCLPVPTDTASKQQKGVGRKPGAPADENPVEPDFIRLFGEIE